jgi:excinuclease UvrABC ATPase subunit
MKLDQLLKPYLHGESTAYDGHPEKALVVQRIMEEMRHSTGARKGAQVHTRRYLFAQNKNAARARLGIPRRLIETWGAARNNLNHLDVDIPFGIFTSGTGISSLGSRG